MAALQPTSLLVELRERLRAHLLLVREPPVFGDLLGDIATVSELLVDRFELLPQVVLALAAVHFTPSLHRDLLLHREQLHLSRQEPVDPAQASEGIERREDLLGLVSA